jgi:hypothetical protein
MEVPPYIEYWQAWAKLGSSISTIFIALAGGSWFILTRRYSKRVEFDLEYDQFFNNEKSCILQLKFTLENKGQVEHKCYNLAFEVVKLQHNGRAISNPEKGFIYRSGNIVEAAAEYYYVRPGVKQRIVHTVFTPQGVRFVKVRAFFTYSKKRMDIDRKKPTMPQRLNLPGWTSLIRVIELKSEDPST